MDNKIKLNSATVAMIYVAQIGVLGNCCCCYFLTELYNYCDVWVVFISVRLNLLVEITGYYARVTSVYSLLKHFITFTKKAGVNSQVISLGAGYDTTYWRLHSAGLQPTSYFEVDLVAVTSRKCHHIRLVLSLCHY